ncbi:MAG TPA: hypothetical protein ENI26_01120 [Methylophaga aminisulfidivorans]|uniref:DUF4388 domain-containing protein n=2 Tax=root TaxID=1 RepID=A0A7C2A9P1_9GAMM|nr:hypothetical protein [Methylophaga aminisulfidivorans]
MTDNRDVLQQLSSLCRSGQSGTFFITTTENRACHILLESGRITALSYGRLRGEEVIDEWANLNIERFSFKSIKMPLAGRSFLDEQEDALSLLGDDVKPSPELHGSQSKDAMVSKTRIYRGVVIQDETHDSAKDTFTSKRKKPSRMYRGQKLDD